MKIVRFAAVSLFMMLVISGCGGGNSSPPVVVTQILSDSTFDGDIELDTSHVFTITQGHPASVFAGIDPITGSEFRAFLDFPLTGAVPGNAIISSARLEIFIDDAQVQLPGSTIPIRIELVSFIPPTLLATDFDRVIQPALAATTIIPPISAADIGHHVSIDVTPLMVEAQHLGLANFQVRILEDDGFVFPGFIKIDDTTNAFAPLLEVAFF